MTLCIEQRQLRAGNKAELFALLFSLQALVSGLLFSLVGWAELFTANLLLGAVVIFATVGRSAAGHAMSTLLACLTAVSLLVALLSWSERGVADANTHLINGIAAILLGLLILNEKYGARPWLPRALRRQHGFSWALGAEVFSTAGIATGLFLTVLVSQAFFIDQATLETGLFPLVLTLFMLALRIWVLKQGANAAISQQVYLPYVLPLRAMGAAVGVGLAVFLLQGYPNGEGFAGASALLLLLALGSTTTMLVAADAPAE
ncbi:hypothetical protein [Ewingella allii]|uniref:hypothetical protein n=1 Tax=Ewingella allii TaxID=3092550 RepID=UPI00379929B3